MQERTARVVVAALSRLMDELDLIIVGSIAIGLILQSKNHDLAGLVHDGVLGIITGLFGYMRGKASKGAAPPAAAPPAPPAE